MVDVVAVAELTIANCCCTYFNVVDVYGLSCIILSWLSYVGSDVSWMWENNFINPEFYPFIRKSRTDSGLDSARVKC
jgi:hypothetical protein